MRRAVSLTLLRRRRIHALLLGISPACTVVSRAVFDVAERLRALLLHRIGRILLRLLPLCPLSPPVLILISLRAELPVDSWLAPLLHTF